MTFEEWFRLVISDSLLETEHEEYLLARGASESALREWKLFTWYSPSIPCPDPSWIQTYGKVLESSLIAPIFSPQNVPIGLEWRKESLRKKIFFSSNSPIWFGMPFEMEKIYEERFVYLVEGYLDALVLKRVTKRAVLAAGTSHLTQTQIDFLERYTDEVRVAFDQDDAGDRGYWVAKKKLSRSDLKFIREEYGKRGDDPPLIWDRGGLDLLKRELGDY